MNYKLTGHHLWGISSPEDIHSFYKKMFDNKASIKYLSKSIIDLSRSLISIDDMSDKNINDEIDIDEEDIQFLQQYKVVEGEFTDIAARKISKNKGDLFELFCEIFFAINQGSPHLGVIDYKFNCEDDYGVDGFAKNPNGDNVVIQVKFRSNPVSLISYGDLAKTLCQGFMTKYITEQKPKTLWLITNCDGANWRAQKMFGNMLHVINREHINTMISGNVNFWKLALDIVEYNINNQ